MDETERSLSGGFLDTHQASCTGDDQRQDTFEGKEQCRSNRVVMMILFGLVDGWDAALGDDLIEGLH